jgi:hypothetical protein
VFKYCHVPIQDDDPPILQGYRGGEGNELLAISPPLLLFVGGKLDDGERGKHGWFYVKVFIGHDLAK